MAIFDSENLSEIRTYVNHIKGFSDMLCADARIAGFPDIEKIFRNISQEVNEIKYILIQSQCHTANVDLLPVVREESARHLYVILIQLVHLETVSSSECYDRFKEFIHEVRVAAYELTRIFENLLDIHTDTFDMSAEEAEKAVLNERQDNVIVEDAEHVILSAGVAGSTLTRLAQFAKSENYTLSVVSAEDDFIEYVHEHSADVILMDIEEIGNGGLFLLELLKNDPVLYVIPVIILSNCSDPLTIVKCIELGAVDFMPLDYTEVLLAARIKAAVSLNAKSTEHCLYVKKLEDTRKTMAKELANGVSYVTGMLPQPFKQHNLTVDWVFLPSLALGGDIFDYRWISPTKFAVYLVDVSGHGIEAALLSVTILNVIKNGALTDVDFLDPAAVLNALNKMFRIEEQNNMYFTAWYGVFDTESRMLTYASAGSQPAIFFPPVSPCENLTTHGLIIGLDPDVAYTNAQRFVSPQSSLYVFSDGVFEIRKRDKQMMNLQEFTEILSMYATIGNDPKDFVSRIVAMSEHKKFEDDVSFIEIHFPD